MNQPLSKPDSRRSWLIIATVVLVLMVLATYLLLFKESDDKSFHEGDFLRYELTGAYDGNLWINVTAANDTVVLFVATWSGVNQTVVNDPDGFLLDDSYFLYIAYHNGISLESLVGGEVMETAFGEREVNHYQMAGNSEIGHDFYCSLEGGVVYRHAQYGDWAFEAVLVETNIDWV